MPESLSDLEQQRSAIFEQMRQLASEISGQTEHVYGECRYATRKTWPWERRVIYKAEVVRAAGKEPKDNPRFVVTNLKQSLQWIYEQVYCPRGDLENQGAARWHGDRTDQLLELLGQHVPGDPDGSGVCADAGDTPAPGTDPPRPAQVSTLRERFLKLGVQVVVAVRRIVLHLSRSFPYLDSLHGLGIDAE